MINQQLDLPFAAIETFCKKHPIQKLSLFGSVLRDDFSPNSDVDVLVEFEPGAKIGYFELVEMQFELSDLIGREVDLLTPGALSRYFRQQVMNTALTIYARH